MIEFPNSKYLLSRPQVAVDTETTGLVWWQDRVFGVALSWYDDFDQVESFYGDLRDPTTARWMRDHLPKLRWIVNHNIKFDAHMLRASKIDVSIKCMDCTMIREAIIDENKYEYGLDALSWKYLNRGKEDIWKELAAMFGGKATKDEQIKNLPKAPPQLVAKYATVDSGNALEIWTAQQEILIHEELLPIAALEQRLMGVIVEMERGGVRVDLDRAERSAMELDKEVKKQQKELDGLAGGPVNVNSGPQVKKILRVHQDDSGDWRTGDGVLLEPTDSGKSGSLKTDRLYQSTMPEAGLVARIRGMIKARDVFLRKYVLEMNHEGYVHANINQTRTEAGDGTYTGRISITEPALQQIHKRQKMLAAIVRSCFVPDEGCEWGCYDWAQADFRVMAHYANDRKVIEAYSKDPKTDFHTLVSQITGLPRDRDEKTGGANSKQLNLGLCFNMGAGRMAKEMRLPFSTDERGYLKAGPEATELFDRYHSAIPGPSRLKRQVESVARNRGYILTQLGRRLRFPNGRGTFKASGILYQAMAAETLKVKMVELAELIQQAGHSRYMLTVHDEHDLSLSKDRPEGFDEEVKNLLQRFDGEITPIKFRVPFLADVGVGPNWWIASK